MASSKVPQRTAQRGTATLQALLVTIAFGCAWGALMPALDHGPYPEADQVREVPADDEAVAQLEADARHRCAMRNGDNGGAIFVDGGLIVCTDKRGRTTSTLRAQR
jgi:hypothetical protein